jgi:hypothetical protein
MIMVAILLYASFFIFRLPELLLLPARRIQEYVTLLSWFECHTPPSHQDRADLANVIQHLKILNKHIQEVSTPPPPNHTRIEVV